MAELQKVAVSWSAEMKKGYVRLAMLMLLSRESLTGYDIMRLIEKKTMGFWRLTPGGIYPNLRKLERKGYIKGHWEPKGVMKKKRYTITDKGRQLLEAALQRQQQMAETMGELFSEFAQEVVETEPVFLRIGKVPSFARFGESLEGKPVSEQIAILKRPRSNMCRSIKHIDDKVKALTNKTKKSKSVDDTHVSSEAKGKKSEGTTPSNEKDRLG
jgi:DNA-binding PadR family transcriptional regulator